MPSTTIRIIDRSNRPWISRELQQFCGFYRLDEPSHLYFDIATPPEHCALISHTFLKAPGRLRAAALYLELTVSTTSQPQTKYGFLSAVYGDWAQHRHKLISPHLEMSAPSLAPELVQPHLVHECSHLFWAIQSTGARDAFVGAMVELMKNNLHEVTDYAQGFYNEWQKLLKLLHQGGEAIVARLNRALEKWVTESFCESVAKICCPGYKHYEEREAEPLLDERRKLIASHFGLEL